MVSVCLVVGMSMLDLPMKRCSCSSRVLLLCIRVSRCLNVLLVDVTVRVTPILLCLLVIP